MKTRRTFIISLALLLTASLATRVGAQDVASGKKLIDTYQWNKANKFFIDQVKNNPADPSLKFYLGETYLALGKVDSAENNFNKGEEFAHSIAGIGKIWLSKNDTVKAKEFFNKALKAEKKNGDLYGYIADACISANYPKLAEQYIARGKDVTSKNGRLWIAIGNLAKLKNNFGDAANAYENAFYYDKTLSIAYVKIGNIYTDSRSWAVATDNYNKAIAVDASNPLAYKGLADVYYKTGRFPEASENFKKYMSLSETTLDDKYRLAFILFYNKESAEATKIINELLSSDSKNPVLLRLQGYMSYELGVDARGRVTDIEKVKSANSNMTEFFKVQPSNKLLPSDYEYLAKSQVALGMDSLAPENYKKAFDLDSSKTGLLNEAVKVLNKGNNFIQQVPYFKILLRVEPENIGLNTYKMGLCYYNEALRKDTAKADTAIRRQHLIIADSAFKTVATLIPTSILGPQMMARCEYALDTKNEGFANPYYEKVIQMIIANNDQVKRKFDLVGAYTYFGSHYYFKAYDALIAKKYREMEEFKAKSKEYWLKIKEVDPQNPKVEEGLKAVEEVKPAPPKKQAQATE